MRISIFHALRLRAFQIATGACALFIVLSGIDLVMNPGSPWADPTLSLSVIALACAGLGLILFFIAFAPFFTRSVLDRFLAWLGTFAGVISGTCLLGVPFAPADLLPQLRTDLVSWALDIFFVAALVYLPVVVRERRQPQPSPIMFAGFAFLFGAYLFLRTFGPIPNTLDAWIQTVGLPIVAYVCIPTLMLESISAIRFMRRSGRIKE